MSLGSFIKKQFIDILQWNEDTDGVLAWRFPMQDFEIQYGGSLTVRESQVAVFVNEGKIADVFGPGLYKLTTQTLPVLTYLKNWDKLFESPFKSDVYFFSTRIQTGRKWGTPQPITLRDKDFGMVRLRAFGMYSYRISDARKFFTELSGTRETYTRDDVEEQLRGILIATMATSLGASPVPFLDMAANQTLMAQQVKGGLAEAFEKYGLGLDEFNVASINLPEELQQAIDKRIAIGMAGDLNKYTQYQVANAIPLAAQNEGGIAGIGAGLAAGVGIGQTFMSAMRGDQFAAAPAAAPATVPTAAPAAPAVPVAESAEARLEKLKGLLDKGFISPTDYDAAKAEVLKQLIG
ncbi:MAG TPA: SPFH domain-containing protein [Rhodocyclaceae bacterium]|jgi:membrane protease subunit (stomatin/prohibitin family)|nr:SPFH domain-containing protein [Rhodocyclaceae bacterium]